MDQDEIYDVLVVGAGINGAGIARDAALRDLRVMLVERGDVAGETSSASTKLIHGGLRYLEHNALTLVRESLAERERLLQLAAHLVTPLRFVIPRDESMRPGWQIRAGLWLYDHLGGGSSLPASGARRLERTPEGDALKNPGGGFFYYDLATNDARLTLANVCGAVEAGADFLPRTAFLRASTRDGIWQVDLSDGRTVSARALVNAAGTGAAALRAGLTGNPGSTRLRFVQGSHIVVPKLYPGDHAYLLQQPDRRVVFVIPWEQRYSLIGTTEVPLVQPDNAGVTDAEVYYLCDAVARFLSAPIAPRDIVWRYAGVRALVDDGNAEASAVSREYRLIEDSIGTAPLVSVYGGKLTTYRMLAERVVDALVPSFPGMGECRTRNLPLPGAEDLPPGGLEELVARLCIDHPRLPLEWLAALARRHGTRARQVVGKVQRSSELGRNFGGGLYEREVRWMLRHEWAVRPDDFLWRRTHCGLDMDESQRANFADWLAKHSSQDAESEAGG
ncbi:MAG: glycerol-3-phosphate dehydrogenase [Rhodocyclaceae bacterium]|nr:glycerol-3-phosphate dehydrogenase [Rhodocyclaceae bacterium]